MKNQVSKSAAQEHRRRESRTHYSQLCNPYFRLTKKTQKLILREQQQESMYKSKGMQELASEENQVDWFQNQLEITIKNQYN